MSDPQGWVSVYRSLVNHWLWQDKPFSKGQAWIDLILLANHKEGKILCAGKVVTAERGSVHRSILSLADRWGWSRKKVTSFLKLLESEGMVTTESTTHGTTITIVKYDIFQSQGTTKVSTEEHPKSNRGTAEEQPGHINNNDNNFNNKNNDNKIITPEEVVELFNRICISFPKVKTITESIRNEIDTILSKYEIGVVKDAFSTAQRSDFLKGNNRFAWKADFEWIMKEKNFENILNGKYEGLKGEVINNDQRKNSEERRPATDFYAGILGRGINLEGGTS